MISKEDHQKLLDYIDEYWEKIILKPQWHRIGGHQIYRVIVRPLQAKNFHQLEVPYTCLVPNDNKFNYIFYWDSFFMFRGLLDTKREWVIPEMVENFIYIFNKYHIIPNLTHPFALGRSQPPFLTSMIFDAYNVLLRAHSITSRIRKIIISRRLWLTRRMDTAKTEYADVWQSTLYNHLVPEYHLNRYGDRDVGYAHSSELESGWDMTSRFYNRCDEFLPIDLNCYLYKYELDFAKAASIVTDVKEFKKWTTIAHERKERINTYMWDEAEGFFFDYDYVHKKRSTFLSLAGFVPMWSGLATSLQAQRMREKLKDFETDYGLTITDESSISHLVDLSSIPEPYRISIENMLEPKQWDYPHIWSPLEYLTVIGLLRYGYIDDAKRIMQKAINTNIQVLKKYGALLEKIDSRTAGAAANFHYPNQFGFGWTNAIIFRYSKLLEAIEEGRHIYTTNTNKPPYTLALPY